MEKKNILIATRLDTHGKIFIKQAMLDYLTCDFNVIIIPVSNRSETLNYYLSLSNTLIIPGGIDVNPKLYNEENLASDYLDKLDEFDFTLLNLAISKGLNIIGICRGMQVINVYFKGSLYQDNPVHKNTRHIINVCQENPLVDSDKLLVNSYHHQGIKKLGNDLEILAKSDDGIIEMIKHKFLPIYGVQYHPEMDDYKPFLQYLINLVY